METPPPEPNPPHAANAGASDHQQARSAAVGLLTAGLSGALSAGVGGLLLGAALGFIGGGVMSYAFLYETPSSNDPYSGVAVLFLVMIGLAIALITAIVGAFIGWLVGVIAGAVVGAVGGGSIGWNIGKSVSAQRTAAQPPHAPTADAPAPARRRISPLLVSGGALVAVVLLLVGVPLLCVGMLLMGSDSDTTDSSPELEPTGVPLPNNGNGDGKPDWLYNAC
jgi:hypothetical protein